jgi:hypothetical protein
MRKTWSVVAALLLALPPLTTADVAVAADESGDLPPAERGDAASKHNSKKAQRTIVMLSALGLAHPLVTEMVYEVDGRTKNGYFMLHEERYAEGQVSLRYQLVPKIGIKQLELRYAPDESNVEYTVRSNAVMVNYRLAF